MGIDPLRPPGIDRVQGIQRQTFADLPNATDVEAFTLAWVEQTVGMALAGLYINTVSTPQGTHQWQFVGPSAGGGGMNLGIANFDAFGRLRISAPTTIFDSKLVYDAQTLYWSESQTGGAAAGVWSSANARVRLTATTGQTSLRQTRRFFNYQPGKSQLIFQTFCMGPAIAGAILRAGYFDDTNGVFFQRDGSALSFVRRSGSSTATTTAPQASWNLDTLDGNGPSGITLDPTTTQILVMDLEWLGVGSVRIGFVINGQIVYAHRFDCANIEIAVYMSTPNLPLRYEVDATAAAGPVYLDCICGTVMTEGGNGSTGTPYGFASPKTGNVGNGASKTLISIRHNASYPRVTIIPTQALPLAIGNGVTQWFLLYNPSIASATWGTTRGYCDLDTAGTATGGTVIASGVISQVAPAVPLNLERSTLTLGADVAGASDTMSLVVTNVSGGNETYIGALNWVALT